MRIDAGKFSKMWQEYLCEKHENGLTTCNKATPAVLNAILIGLRGWTETILAAADEHLKDPRVEPGSRSPIAKGWLERLSAYEKDVNECIRFSRHDDPECTENTFLPLFWGEYPQADGTWRSSRADVSTPAIMANMLAAKTRFDAESSVGVFFRYALDEADEKIKRVVKEVDVTWKTAKKAAKTATSAFPFVAGVAVTALLVSMLNR